VHGEQHPELSAAALAGRVALVTGASRGIGRATAELLHAAGARLVLVARGGVLDEVAAGLGADAVPADLADADAVAALADAVQARHGAPDLVVHAAGAFTLARVADTEVAAFDRLLAVNLRAAFLLARAFLPGMVARGSGQLVSIGSIAGRVGFPANGAYSASKFGLRGLHAVLDAELRGSGVRATLIEPAATDTGLWDAIDGERHPGLPARAAMLRARDVAEAVLFAVTRPPDTVVRNIILDRN
jgi:NADP-dependent 3-hydroxy acid dehydrogenase YdfG